MKSKFKINLFFNDDGQDFNKLVEEILLLQVCNDEEEQVCLI